MSSRGKFITFEGCEAAGKSTQVRILRDFFSRIGLNAISTKEPGGTDFAEEIRNIFLSREIQDPMIELLLLSAARRDHTKKILEWLHDGVCVISDRYVDSSRVYQGIVKNLDAGCEGIDIEKILILGSRGLEADLTIVLDVNIDTIRDRISKSESHFGFYDNKDVMFHVKIREAFLKIQREYSDRIYVIDGNNSIEVVHMQIISLLKELMIIP